MKARIIPTSPRYHDQANAGSSIDHSRIVPNLSVIIGIVFSSILISIAAAIGILVLAERHPTAPLLRYVALGRSGESVIIRQDSKSDTEQAQRVVEATKSSLFTIIRHRTEGEYRPSDRIGLATSFTSDGLAVMLDGSHLADENDVLTQTGEHWSTAALSSTAWSFTFINVQHATSPMSFIDVTQLAEGMTVWVLKYDGLEGGLHVMRSTVVSLRERSTNGDTLLESSDEPTRRFQIDRQFGDDWRGAVVVNNDGRLIGLLEPGTLKGTGMIPVSMLKRRLSEVSRSGELRAATLGVTYLDLAYPHLAVQPDKGALLTSAKELGLTAVRTNSPAAKAGLRENDVITAVDNVPLTSRRSLAEALTDFSPGQTVTFDVTRNHTQLRMNITLGEST